MTVFRRLTMVLMFCRHHVLVKFEIDVSLSLGFIRWKNNVHQQVSVSKGSDGEAHKTAQRSQESQSRCCFPSRTPMTRCWREDT